MTADVAPPKYRLIEQALRSRIEKLHPGDALPSDAELCVDFGVSRMTARVAMQRLADAGLVRREPGRGSYVAEPPAHRRANRLMTFSREMRRLGRQPSSRILARKMRMSTAQEALRLGLETGEPIIVLRRLRLADGRPMAIEEAHLDGRCAAAVMEADLEAGSLHEALGRAGYVLRRGTGTITAEAAGPEDAQLLEVAERSPLLVERRVILDARGRRVEATESRYPADRYGLDVRFDVDDGAPGRAAPEVTSQGNRQRR
jgi:GntR family transcriptional regulator